MKSVRRPTLREVAALAGVSKAAVSLALRNHPSIPAGTQARIRRAANELGYRPNPLVSAYQQHVKSGQPQPAATLGYLVRAHPQLSRLDGLIWDGVRARAAQLGYQIEWFNLGEPGMTEARLTQILYTRSIRGLIVAPFEETTVELALDWSRFAAAAVGQNLAKPALHRTMPDHYRGMELALAQARRLGYRRIGLCLRQSDDQRRDRQWSAAFLRHNLHQPRGAVVPPLLMADAAELPGWLRAVRPEVILGLNYTLISRALAAQRRRIPRDVGFIHLHVTPPYAGRDYAGIDQRLESVGAAAVDLVAGQLYRNEYGLPAVRKSVAIEPAWCAGPSVRPA